ncbi:hypothetical protein QA640_28975 [Bradyrhizobium sp. CB82]|uniref:hypothetical protein n=1 Tax=Bradyrhizobium sp. CB82 TaxID=3039159 RepID=UPI0024B074B8|nr:hypothetical protein [Bradyrhizobium sp. CB82]WFU45375.1 hypothetical protein QA640_28975 [Bradyrhizobium sp. CB82]
MTGAASSTKPAIIPLTIRRVIVPQAPIGLQACAIVLPLLHRQCGRFKARNEAQHGFRFALRRIDELAAAERGRPAWLTYGRARGRALYASGNS